jgi:ABC-type Mn2+/Zn2+ transport system ATPase subunit
MPRSFVWHEGKILHDRIDVVLQRFALTDRIHDMVGTLSGGLQRRVELAKGLLHQPTLLLLDEPSTDSTPVRVGTSTTIFTFCEIKKERRLY